MSADNGIYILKTDGPEYRVAMLQAIESLYYVVAGDVDGRARFSETDDPDLIIINARVMWRHAEVFKTHKEALKLAVEMMKDTWVCEYGICDIRIDRKF